MGMGNSFETITVLQYRLKAAQEELAAFQSGEKYIRMEKQHLTQGNARHHPRKGRQATPRLSVPALPQKSSWQNRSR